MLARVAAAVAFLLLAGCAGPGPASPAAEPQDLAAPGDGTTVTATRVEPLVHAVDAAGTIRARACSGPRTEDCAGGGVPVGAGAVGIDWDAAVHDFADPAALFWRAGLRLDWETEGLARPVLRIAATTPCGIACVEERAVAVLRPPEEAASQLGLAGAGAATGPATIVVEPVDIFLEPGETGVRVTVEPEEYNGETSVRFRLQGAVAGYRAVAPPVVLA